MVRLTSIFASVKNRDRTTHQSGYMSEKMKKVEILKKWSLKWGSNILTNPHVLNWNFSKVSRIFFVDLWTCSRYLKGSPNLVFCSVFFSRGSGAQPRRPGGAPERKSGVRGRSPRKNFDMFWTKNNYVKCSGQKIKCFVAWLFSRSKKTLWNFLHVIRLLEFSLATKHWRK